MSQLKIKERQFIVKRIRFSDSFIDSIIKDNDPLMEDLKISGLMIFSYFINKYYPFLNIPQYGEIFTKPCYNDGHKEGILISISSIIKGLKSNSDLYKVIPATKAAIQDLEIKRESIQAEEIMFSLLDNETSINLMSDLNLELNDLIKK